MGRAVRVAGIGWVITVLALTPVRAQMLPPMAPIPTTSQLNMLATGRLKIGDGKNFLVPPGLHVESLAMIAQVPHLAMRAPEPDAHSVVVVNVGNASLKFLAQGDQGTWQDYEVASQQSVRVWCQDCSDRIQISYHDGQSTQAFVAPVNRRYLLFWNGLAARWNLSEFRVEQAARDRLE